MTQMKTAATFKSVNPARPTEVVGHVEDLSIEMLEKIVNRAQRAHSGWAMLPAPERGMYLHRAADELQLQLEDIAITMTKEMGKTLAEAKGETARGVAILRYFAGEGMREIGQVIPSADSDALMYTTRCPLGVVGAITPWNFPVAIPIWKIAPALAYGNTVILKPAEEASVTARKVIACFHSAQFPEGVVNIATGQGTAIGKALVEHPYVSAITFTGSNAVGKQIGRTALERGAKYQLEMGGKNPVIVTKDADLDVAVEATISGGLKSTGQKCTATSRVIVEEDVYDAFKEKLLRAVEAITIGDGLEASTWMGPLATKAQFEKVLEAIDKGKKEGATLLAGGNRVSSLDGYFIEPTVFENVDHSKSLAQEEIFGPVLALFRISSIQEAIALANNSEYGLSASIFTTNIQEMLTFTTEMQAGLIRVNAESAGVELQAPFGGMKSSSSHSREQGRAAIEFFTSVKTVFVKG
ncbi:alpha-ketoglutaric semialdehyde dehydrogenase GucD [Geomicrobium sediminis]|uniref:Aldehyde dehydrogenase (NAD+) n=1 Tax=Geomicrobium sediminis TaxID=1347788 RepID=A0ABS2PD97_9BACL|nr:alpha-ketoglutaric semialdehyde dehydrogenase GucD [Geomicrobium sediminis]MBM7633399.1 aldehyde dehydrogenase (NAD+) [Geomicrobium sediminis]